MMKQAGKATRKSLFDYDNLATLKLRLVKIYEG